MLPERPDVHPERAQTCPPTHGIDCDDPGTAETPDYVNP